MRIGSIAVRRIAVTAAVLACLGGGLTAAPAAATVDTMPSAAGCEGATVDAAVSAVTLCGTVTITGTGGDAFDVVVPSDTVISLGACGSSPRESYLCDLATTGESDLRGLVLHEHDPEGSDWAYQVLAERSQRLTGGYRELTVGRGFVEVIHDRQEAIIVPAGRYRVRLLGDEREMTLRWTTGAAGSVEVVPAAGAIDWREVEPAYGNSTAGGAGENVTIDGPTLAIFAYGWLPDYYVTEAQFGSCWYEKPTTIEQTSWAPGCPDRVTGSNTAFEFAFGPGFGGPFGQGFALSYAGDTNAFGWGGYHASFGVAGTQTAVALRLALD